MSRPKPLAATPRPGGATRADSVAARLAAGAHAAWQQNEGALEDQRLIDHFLGQARKAGNPGAVTIHGVTGWVLIRDETLISMITTSGRFAKLSFGRWSTESPQSVDVAGVLARLVTETGVPW